MEPMNEQPTGPQQPEQPTPTGQPAPQAHTQPAYEQSVVPEQAAPAYAQPEQAPQQPQYAQPQAPAYDQPQPAPNGVPQWIPATPPAHPYAGGAPKPGAKWIAITAMAVGLVALLTLLVSVFYFSTAFSVAAGVLGIAAVALGVVAMVKRSRPFGAGITGLATGALTIVATCALFSVVAFNGTFGGAPDTPAAPGSTEGETWTPDTEQESLLTWPANMQTGGVLFTGPGDPRPIESEPLKAGAAPTPNQVDRAAKNDILIYVDYRCPHCGIFEQQNGDYLAELMAAGDTTVEIVPLSFMDRNSEGSYYSSRAAGAVACYADAQPESAWAAHRALLSAGVQPGAGPGLSNEQLLAALEEEAGPVSSAVRDCVTNEAFVPFAQALNEWVFQNPVPNTLDANVRLEGTPTIVVNGVVYTGDAADPAAFKAFVEGLAL